jgi:choline dehydrogenase-like flavoprotein
VTPTAYDFIIIGSGAGGGRVAYELSRKGARCLILEAGRSYSPDELPLGELETLSRLYWGGGLELSDDASVVFTRGKCVGGSSLVNQALLNRFDDAVWSHWREQSGVWWLDAAHMNGHYDVVTSQIAHQTLGARQFNHNSRLLADALVKRGFVAKGLVRAHRDCDGFNCMTCLGGCGRQSKQSSAVTTVAWALKQGADIEDGCFVEGIEVLADQVRVCCLKDGTRRRYTCNELVLAAGAIGTTSILLRSGFHEKLPMIGKNFFCHPQYLSCADMGTTIDAHLGHFQGVYSHDQRLRDIGIKIESSFLPPALFAQLVGGSGASLMSLVRRYRFCAALEICIRDDVPGRIRVDRRGRTTISKRLSKPDLAKLGVGRRIADELFDTMGARSVHHSNKAFSVHPMGGCALGSGPDNGVVDEEFSLIGYKRIHVADVSLFPGAPGTNPSLTVMALAHKAGEMILSRHQ